MKFDKATLIKHRFWVLLGVTIPLVLAAIFILITSVGAENEKSRKSLEDKLKAVSGIASPVGPPVIEKLKEVADTWKTSETVVHQEAFKRQNDIFTWPAAVEKRFNFQGGLFATEIKIIAKSTEPPADETHLFHGEITSADPDAFVVVNKDKKKAKFHRTFGVKVSTQEKKEGEGDPQWSNLGKGQYVAVTFYQSKYFWDKLTSTEQEVFTRSYASQIEPILKIVDPMDAQGNGVVQLNGWLYQPGSMPPARSKFLTFVAEQWQADGFIYDEAWMAQEDLWVQRDLYQLIRLANDMVAKCKGTAVDGKAKPAVFTNPYYELKFEWEGEKLFATVKNMLPRRQKLDVQFRVKFNKSDSPQLSTETIEIGGEPLDPYGMPKGIQRTLVTLERDAIQRTGIYEVEQVLTWETAAVKRIDHVAIGTIAADIAHSHRTFTKGSSPYRKDETKVEVAKTDFNPMSIGPPGGNTTMGDQKVENLTLNGLLKDRYLEVSEQSRRIPVGLSLIVDQDHVDRVLTAFSNSRLRFLTTQVLLNRYPGSLRPQLVGSTGGPTNQDSDVSPPTPPMFTPRSLGPMGIPAPGGFSKLTPSVMPGDTGPGPTGLSAPGGTEDVESNIEMVIYGVATLYERYPKRTIPVGEVKDAK